MRSASDDGERQAPLQDLPLAAEERDDLLRVCAQIFRHRAAADRVLDRIGFPREMRPTFTEGASLDAWSGIFEDLDNGVLPGGVPYWRLLSAIVGPYPTNPTARGIAQRHGLIEPDATAEPVNAPGAPQAPQRSSTAQAPHQNAGAWHIIVRADTEDDRQKVREILDGLGFGPTEVWSTANAVSYRLTVTDASGVRRGLEQSGIRFGWTLVAPDEPDYLIPSLYIQGPDGRQFLIEDAPAQQTVANVAAEVVDQYPSGFAGAARPTVVDLDRPGARRRLGSDETLHDAGIVDGDHLHVGFQATAGAVNPVDRQDALYRVRNEITNFAATHDGVTVKADSALLPMRYQLSFTAPGWAPPSAAGGQPELITRHLVEIALGPEFPLEPPVVTWRSRIFHPNVMPMYQTPQRQIAKEMQGKVCLGVLAESYQPAMSFEDLCQTLIDMASYRNYGLQDIKIGADGQPKIVGNAVDGVAAVWAERNPERIEQVGGVNPAKLRLQLEPERADRDDRDYSPRPFRGVISRYPADPEADAEVDAEVDAEPA